VGKDYLHQHAGNIPPNAPQDTIRRLCAKSALLAHVQIGVCQDPWLLFCKAVFQPISPQSILVYGIIPPQEFAVQKREPHEIPVCPFLQSVEIPLDGSTTR